MNWSTSTTNIIMERKKHLGWLDTARLGIATEGRWTKGSRVGDLVFLAGQVAWDTEGKIVGVGDAGLQARQALINIRALLSSAGAKLSDIVKITVYVTDLAYRPQVYAEIVNAFGGDCPSSTGLVVQGLARPELLVEIDAIAAISRTRGTSRRASERRRRRVSVSYIRGPGQV